MVSQTNINAFTDISRFGALRSEAGKNPGEAVGKVAREFEALFIEMMLSSARKAAIKGGMFESHALELYKEMFDTQAARVLAEQGTLGFDQAISRFADIEAQNGSTQSAVVAHSYPGQPEANQKSETKESAPSEEEMGLFIPAIRADLPIPTYNYPVSKPQSAGEIQISGEKILPPKADIPGMSVSAVQSDRVEATEQYNFSQAIATHANEAARKLGTEPAILIAQAALETGWGAHVIPGEAGASSNNIFGIKATSRWQGDASQVTTLEFLGGRPINTKASFRRYPDIKSAFDDYVNFVTNNPRYSKALAHASDGDSYIRELAKAGYATDPKYAEKIISIKNRIESMNMLADANEMAPKAATTNNSTQTRFEN